MISLEMAGDLKPRMKSMGTGLDGDDNTLLLAKDWKPARVEDNKWALHPNSLFRAILDICSLLVQGLVASL